MFPLLLSVVVISLSGAMQPGIVTAMTIAKSYKSPWAGPYVALGHAAIEVPLILLIYFGFAQFFQNTVVQMVLSIAGGGMIIWMGISMFRARTEITQQGKDLPYNAFTAGIFTSVLNPFFWLWWLMGRPKDTTAVIFCPRVCLLIRERTGPKCLPFTDRSPPVGDFYSARLLRRLLA